MFKLVIIDKTWYQFCIIHKYILRTLWKWNIQLLEFGVLFLSLLWICCVCFNRNRLVGQILNLSYYCSWALRSYFTKCQHKHIYTWIYTFRCRSVDLPIHRSIDPSIHPFINSSIHQFINLLIRLFVRSFVPLYFTPM